MVYKNIAACSFLRSLRVTVHFVDEGVDTGPIIRQERVAIDPSWDLETLESHVHAMEYDLFWQVIEQVAKSIEEEKE